jgi:hypothetical protein
MNSFHEMNFYLLYSYEEIIIILIEKGINDIIKKYTNQYLQYSNLDNQYIENESSNLNDEIIYSNFLDIINENINSELFICRGNHSSLI